MRRIRITHPVFGLIVSAMIGAGCLTARAAAPTSQPTAIVPGEQVGLVRIGMTDAELQKAMGQPDSMELPKVRDYPNKRMRVLLSKDKPPVVNAILVGDPNGRAGEGGVVDFKGKTAEGIGMGSSSEQIKKQYGEPEKDEQSDPQTDFRLLIYDQKGIQFGLMDGKVTWFAVRKAAGG